MGSEVIFRHKNASGEKVEEKGARARACVCVCVCVWPGYEAPMRVFRFRDRVLGPVVIVRWRRLLLPTHAGTVKFIGCGDFAEGADSTFANWKYRCARLIQYDCCRRMDWDRGRQRIGAA